MTHKPFDLEKAMAAFVLWAFDCCIMEGGSLDGFEVEEKLHELGLIERKETDPSENSFEADYLCFLNDELKEKYGHVQI